MDFHRKFGLGRMLAALGLMGAALAVVLGTTGASARPSVHRFTAHAKIAILDSKTAGGSVTGGPFGRDGAAILNYRLNGSKITGTFIGYSRGGSASGTVTVTITGLPDGSARYAGSARITSGTGAYRGAHGTVTVTGTAPPGAGSIGLFTLKYVVTY
jgi:hypothetical protein